MNSELAGPCQRSNAQLCEQRQVECWKKGVVVLEDNWHEQTCGSPCRYDLGFKSSFL